MSRPRIYLALTVALIPQLTCCGNWARAQTDGDEKCGPDGYILAYNEYQRGWLGTSRPCKEKSADPSKSSAPIDGDEKCGPNGHILKYSGYEKRWSDTARKCS